MINNFQKLISYNQYEILKSWMLIIESIMNNAKKSLKMVVKAT